MNWTAKDIPTQIGKTIIVTGANTGLGFETSKALAAKGAKVILACRDEHRGQAALERIQKENPRADLELMRLDLSSLQSVREFSESFLSQNDRLDILINNAGVMTPPEAHTTEGFELQIGVNFLGHFLLTALLFDRLQQTENARIVTLSSLMHRPGKIDIDSFLGPDKYKPWREYSQSKLACLMFALELQKRLEANEIPIKSMAAHPGGTKSDLQRHSLMSRMMGFLLMETSQGALPTLYAATEPNLKGGEYIGPNGWFELGGHPAPSKIAKQAHDTETSKQLWEAAEKMCGVSFGVGQKKALA